MAVKDEEFTIKASAGRGRRSFKYPAVNSAARCGPPPRLPPLPKKNTLPPPRKDSTIFAATRATCSSKTLSASNFCLVAMLLWIRSWIKARIESLICDNFIDLSLGDLSLGASSCPLFGSSDQAAISARFHCRQCQLRTLVPLRSTDVDAWAIMHECSEVALLSQPSRQQFALQRNLRSRRNIMEEFPVQQINSGIRERRSDSRLFFFKPRDLVIRVDHHRSTIHAPLKRNDHHRCIRVRSPVCGGELRKIGSRIAGPVQNQWSFRFDQGKSLTDRAAGPQRRRLDGIHQFHSKCSITQILLNRFLAITHRQNRTANAMALQLPQQQIEKPTVGNAGQRFRRRAGNASQPQAGSSTENDRFGHR